MDELDLAAQIKLIAFQEVRDGGAEYQLRKLYRWYAGKFNTALHLVPTLPFTDILQAYFEENFEQMDAEELEAERRILVETETERIARLAEVEQVAQSGADFDKFADAEAKRLESTKIPKQTAVGPVAHPHRKEAPEATMEAGPAIEPDVHVSFVSEGFFEDLMSKIDGE